MQLLQLMNYTMTISDQPTVQKGLCEVNQFHTPFHHLKVVASRLVILMHAKTTNGGEVGVLACGMFCHSWMTA